MYATASYKRSQFVKHQEGVWCIGRILPVFYGEDLSGYALWQTEDRNTYAPKDLDEVRAQVETDIIIARLMAV